MKKPAHVIEIFLQPGDFYFGDRNTRIRTVLGSCVSITIWHPRLLIGGMCHYMLPTRGKKKPAVPDGRYADEALELFLRETRAVGTRPGEYQVKLFGGGNMFPNAQHRKHCVGQNCVSDENSACRHVSCRNSKIARHLVESNGFTVTAEHLGGDGHRQVFFDIWTGHVWARQNPVVSPMMVAESARVMQD